MGLDDWLKQRSGKGTDATDLCQRCSLLASADCCSERAILAGSFQLKTPSSSCRAWLSRVIRPDQRPVGLACDFRAICANRIAHGTGNFLLPSESKR